MGRAGVIPVWREGLFPQELVGYIGEEGVDSFQALSDDDHAYCDDAEEPNNGRSHRLTECGSGGLSCSIWAIYG